MKLSYDDQLNMVAQIVEDGYGDTGSPHTTAAKILAALAQQAQPEVPNGVRNPPEGALIREAFNPQPKMPTREMIASVLKERINEIGDTYDDAAEAILVLFQAKPRIYGWGDGTNCSACSGNNRPEYCNNVYHTTDART